MHRAEIVKSMGTPDRDDAVLLAAEWNHRVLKLFQRLKTDGPQMTTDEIDTMVARYLSVKMDGTEAALSTPGQTSNDLEGTEWRLQDQLETAEMDLKFNRFAVIRKDALQLLDVTSVDEDSDSFRVLCRRLLEARVEALWAELRARQGGTLERPARATQVPVSVPAVAPTSPACPLLSKAFETFNDTEGTRKKWRPQTRDDHKLVQRVLLDFLGDKPVGEVTKVNLMDWYKMIRMIPMKRGSEFKGMTIPAIVKATMGQDRPRIADKTINARYLSAAKAFFAFAEKVDFVSKSPATALDPIKLTTGGTDSKTFTADELTKVFGGLREAATRVDHEGYYWVAVLALHSGARLDEIAGLQLTDIRETEGVLCLHIDERGGRSLKNEFSARIVPIHSRCFELGFQHYIDGQTGPRLVSNLTRSNLGKFGGPVSVFFNQYLKTAGVKTSRNQNFHSLRHTWATAARRAGIPDADADELGGWSKSGSQRSRTYAADHTIPAKAALIERLKFI
jgi:integrase